MPDLAAVPDLVAVTLTPLQRVQFDAYLAPMSAAQRDTAEMAHRCRQAVNVRAVLTGKATEPESIEFYPDEIAFLRGQLRVTREAMDGLLTLLG